MATVARGKVAVNDQECKGCGLCVESCPPKCLELAAGLSAYGVHPARLRDRQGPHVTSRRHVRVAYAVATVVNEDAIHRAVAEKVAVMLLARDAQAAEIELRQRLEMRSYRFNGRQAKLLALQTGHQRITCAANHIDG